MKQLLLALALFGSCAFAQGQGKQNNILVDASFNAGGFHFGGGYDYIYNGAQSLGGHFHYFSKDKKHGANGLMIFGGETGFHFYKGDWDFVLAPSMNIINIDSYRDNPGDKTCLGPGIAIGLTTALNDRVAIGFDYTGYYVWFGDDYRGFQISDLAFKVKVGF